MDLNDKQNQQEIKDYPGLLKPFTTLRVKDVPALDLQRLPYQGTLFRLPFRTEEPVFASLTYQPHILKRVQLRHAKAELCVSASPRILEP